MNRIILASSSPRRSQLLEQLGLPFEVVPSGHPEDHDVGGDPHELVKSLSLAKAKAVAAEHREAVVIAADTVVEFHGQILGKPQTGPEAAGMLETLNGRAHRVITGFTVMTMAGQETVTRSVETTVHLKRLTREEIGAYVASGEPLGKAGAYAIQGLGAVIIDRIEGDYYNVVGLPLNALSQVLQDFGISVLRETR